MKSTLPLAALAASLAAAAQAQTFTSSSTAEPNTVLTMPAVGQAPALRVAHWKGTIAAKFDDGVRNSTYECVGYPGGTAGQNINVCEGKEGPTNTFAMRISCMAGTGACFGSLVGTGGRYAGRTGSFVQTTKDGKNFSQGSWH